MIAALNQGQNQSSPFTHGRYWLALMGLGFFILGSPLPAATIQLDVAMLSGTAIHSSGGSAVSGGTAYVGSFFNGSTAMSKSAVAALWDSTRTGFNTLWSRFVSVASSSVSVGTFAISTAAEVDNVAGKSLVGKNVYVLVVDNASSPTGFLLLASDGSGAFDTFASPTDFFEAATTLMLSGEEVPIEGFDPEPASTTLVAGSYNVSSDRWTMASIPGGTATPTITGAATAAAFTTTYGTASAAQTFPVSGANLTASLVATAPTGLEVSSDGTTYGSTATFAQSGGSASGTLRVRLAATAAVSGSYNSQNIVLSSTGATSVNVATAASGNSVSAKALTISGLTATDKDFDGTTTATVSGTPAYVGLVNGETFSVSGTVTWAFPDAAVGSGKTLSRSGSYSAPSANYSVTQPTLTASIRALPTLRLLSLGSPVYTNGNTTITHTFAGNPSATYVLEYKSSLSSSWLTNGVVTASTNFSVTFTNSGVNSTNEWKNRMFFRVKNG